MPTRSILVVEDDGDTRQVLGELLTGLFPDVRVLMAESGEAALELIRRTPPSVVLLDLHLRGIQGFEFARRVRDLSAGAVPIVALTGDASPATVSRAQAEGFAGYLVKPTDAGRLERALKSAMRPAS
ncbi:MAG TPA: response regulator [Methylomirabilota bacterium]